MLGVDRELEWAFSGEGLTVRTPDRRPCEDAYVLRIARKRPFQL